MLGPLHRDRKLDVWSDLRIRTGARWREEIDRGLRRARAAVLLVSPAFLASDFIVKNELASLLEGAARDGVPILWIPVRQSRWRYTAIEAYQAAHDPARPLDRLTRPQRRSVLLKIADSIP